MIGSMQKVWPWKRVLESIIINGKKRVLTDEVFMPDKIGFEVLMAFIIMAVGFFTVSFIEKASREKNEI